MYDCRFRVKDRTSVLMPLGGLGRTLRLRLVRWSASFSSLPRVRRPVALAMIFSWLAAAISRVPLERPSHITMTRSLMPSTSSSSEEIMMMANPPSASWFMSL